jgi:putative transposase
MRQPFAIFFQKMVGPAAKHAAVAHLQAGHTPVGTAGLLGGNRKMIRYRSIRPPDAALRGRLYDLANERRRWGDSDYIEINI